MAGDKFPESYRNEGFHLVCHDPFKISFNGFITQESPLNYASTLLLLQLSLCLLTSLFIDQCIRPLGQTTMVSQIFGGIVFGPSLLGHPAVLGPLLFPPRGRVPFVTFSAFGLMFFVFLVGVQMDGKMMIRPDWKHVILGVSPMLANLMFTVPVAVKLKNHISMDENIANVLPVIAAAQSISSFTNISTVLRDLKMLQSDLGRLATSSAMICDAIGMTLSALMVATLPAPEYNPLMVVGSLGCSAGLVIVLVFLVRPLTQRFLRRLPEEGKSVGESHVLTVFLLVLVFGIVSEVIGQHFILGPMLLGVVIPEGPPLGSALTEKLEIPVGKLLYPSFLTASGLKTNIFTIQFKSFWSVTLVIFLSCVVKTGAVMFSASRMDISLKDSFVLGLMFNAKGVMELNLYNMFMDGKVLNAEAFTLCVLSVIGVTAVVTPLIRFLYDPSKQHIPLKWRTIQHMRLSELRIMVCIHNQEEVPLMVDILEASHATEDRPIYVIALLLEEMVGRAAPVLIAHQTDTNLQTNNFKSEQIFNAFRQYELCNRNCVTTGLFSSITEFDIMDEDICRVGLDQDTNIIILPFHKNWEIDGTITSVNRAVQVLNRAVLEKASCSVAILVDKRIVRNKGRILNDLAYHVAVIYIGGADDAEALCYGNQMASHPNVSLTVIRYLLLGSGNTRERKLDNKLIDKFCWNNIRNERFVYQEEVVKDSLGLAASVKGLGNNFNLILVGMHHPDSPLLVGLAEWIECPELGVLGDMLAEPDVKQSASLFVVQQHRIRGNFFTRGNKPVIPDFK